MLNITEEDLKKVKRRAASRYVLTKKSSFVYSNAIKEVTFPEFHSKFKMMYRDNPYNYNVRLAQHYNILKLYCKYVKDCLIDGRKVKFFFKNETKGLGHLYVKIAKNYLDKRNNILKDKVILKWMKPRYRKTNSNKIKVDNLCLKFTNSFLRDAYIAYENVVGLKKAIEKGNFFPITTNNYGYRRVMNNLPILNDNNKKSQFSTKGLTKQELDEYLEYERNLKDKWIIKKTPLKVTDVTTGEYAYYMHIPHLASNFNVHPETIARYVKLKLFYLDKFLIEKYNENECS